MLHALHHAIHQGLSERLCRPTPFLITVLQAANAGMMLSLAELLEQLDLADDEHEVPTGAEY